MNSKLDKLICNGIGMSSYGNHYVITGDLDLLKAHIRKAVGEEMLDYGSWLKPQCDLHEKYTSACCGCQKARAVFNEIENYQSWIKQWQG